MSLNGKVKKKHRWSSNGIPMKRNLRSRKVTKLKEKNPEAEVTHLLLSGREDRVVQITMVVDASLEGALE